MAQPFRVIEGGKGRPIYVPPPRNRLPIWQWLTLVGQLLALTVGSFLVTATVAMVAAAVLGHN